MGKEKPLPSDIEQYFQYRKERIEKLPLQSSTLEFHIGSLLDGGSLHRGAIEEQIGPRATDAFKELYETTKRLHVPLLELVGVEHSHVKHFLTPPALKPSVNSQEATKPYLTGRRLYPFLAPDAIGHDIIDTPANDSSYPSNLEDFFSPIHPSDAPFRYTKQRSKELLGRFYSNLYGIGEQLLLFNDALLGNNIARPGKPSTIDALRQQDEQLASRYHQFYLGDSPFVNQVASPRHKFVHGDLNFRLFPKIPDNQRPYDGMQFQITGMEEPVSALGEPVYLVERIFPEINELLAKSIETYQANNQMRKKYTGD